MNVISSLLSRGLEAIRANNFEYQVQNRRNAKAHYVNLAPDAEFQYEPEWSLLDFIEPTPESFIKMDVLLGSKSMADLRAIAVANGVRRGRTKREIIAELWDSNDFQQRLWAIQQLRQDSWVLYGKQPEEDQPLPSYNRYLATPMDEIVSAIDSLEVLTYGQFLITMDIRWRQSQSDRDSIWTPKVGVRSNTRDPTRQEIIEGLAMAVRHNTSMMGSVSWGDIRSDSVVIEDAYTVSAVRANTTMNWKERAHFMGGRFSYPTWTQQAVVPSILGSLEGDMETKTCCYDMIAADLGLDAASVMAIVGKTMDEGLTGDDLIAVYKSAGASLYVYDFLDELKFYTVQERAEHDADNGHGAAHRIFVCMLGNNHVYIPKPEKRAELLKRTPDKVFTSEPDEESDVIIVDELVETPVEIKHADDLAQAMELAAAYSASTATYRDPSDEIKQLEQERRQKIDVCTGSYRIQIITIETEMDMTVEQQASRSHATRNVKALKKPFKERIAVLESIRDAEILRIKTEARVKIVALKATKKSPAELRREARQVTPMRIYINSANISADYLRLIHERKLVYASNIDQWHRVTMIKYAPNIHIFANEDFEGLKATATELKLPYINQAIPALARQAFARHRRLSASPSWEKSVLNNAISEIIEKAPAGQLVYKAETQCEPGEELHGVDYYRHYASIAVRGGFYTVSLLTEVEKYDLHPIGEAFYMYYVETTEALALQGNGLYDYQVVAEALALGLITSDNIKWQVRVNRSTVNDTTARDFVNKIYTTVSNDKHRKLIINAWLGSMGAHNEMSAQQSVIVDNVDEACYYYHALNKTKKHVQFVPNEVTIVPGSADAIRAGLGYFSELDKKDNAGFYLTTGFDAPLKRSTDTLIRRAIVQRGRMLIYKLAQQIKAWPGTRLVGIKTDCVVYAMKPGQAPFPVSQGDERKFGDTRKDDATIDEEWKGHTPTPKMVTWSAAAQAWNEPEEVSETEGFDAARLLKYKRVFISGTAGMGKSYILSRLIALKRERCELCKANEKSKCTHVKVCAFTHAAATLVGGQTAHSAVGIKKNGQVCERKIKALIAECQAIFIDEISMLPQVIYNVLTQLPQEIEIYAAGDFTQFKPIEGHSETDRLYVDTTMFKSLFNYTRVTLRKNWRQNKEAAMDCLKFFDAMSRGEPDAPMLLPTEIGLIGRIEDLPRVNICYTNETRRAVNTIIMEREFAQPCHFKDRVMRTNDKPGHMYCYEKFDARKLWHIIKNAAQYVTQFGDSRSRGPEECVDIARKYLTNSTIGEDGIGLRRVEYTNSSFCKRWTPVGSLGMANITKKIRHSVLSNFYVDIDMVNCHPVILLHMCRKMGVDAPKLAEYVEQRDAVFAKLGEMFKTIDPTIGRDDIKRLILRVINGGVSEYKRLQGEKCQWIREFKDECDKVIAPAFHAKYHYMVDAHRKHRREEKKWEGSDAGAFVNTFMLSGEAKVLDSILKVMRRHHLCGPRGNDVILSADGLMALKSPKLEGREVLDECERQVAQDNDGLVIKLIYKPMEPMEMTGPFEQPVGDDSWLPWLDDKTFDEFGRLGVGMPVIANQTTSSVGYFNNQTFTVASTAHQGHYEGWVGDEKRARRGNVEGSLILLVESETKPGETPRKLMITQRRLRMDFRPAYCTTAHKAQGRNIYERYAIHEFKSFDAHGAYVAITRGPIEHVNIVTIQS
jgi:hypothetical protein